MRWAMVFWLWNVASWLLISCISAASIWAARFVSSRTIWIPCTVCVAVCPRSRNDGPIFSMAARTNGPSLRRVDTSSASAVTSTLVAIILATVLFDVDSIVRSVLLSDDELSLWSL